MAIIDRDLLAQVDFGRVLYLERCSLKKVGIQGKRVFLDLWVKELLSTDFDVPARTAADCVFFRSLEREDYKKLMQSVRVSVEEYNVLSVEAYRQPRRSASRQMHNVLKQSDWLLEFIIDEDPLTRACLLARLTQYVIVLERLFSNEMRLLVLFADMQSIENFAAQIARIRGIPSVTLQHGLYVDYGSMNTVNVVNYLHHEADVFLAWGENTKQLIKRYHPDATVEVCGKPNVFDSAGSASVSVPESPYLYVVLDQSVFDEQNVAMLQCLLNSKAQHGYDVFVKFHPLSDKAFFFSKFPQIREGASVEAADWVIGHTSSLMYEAIAIGKRVLRFRSSAPALQLSADISFNTESELLALISQNDLDYDAIKNELIGEQGANSSRRYAEVISRMLDSGQEQIRVSAG